MNFIDASLFCADAFAARRISRAITPSSGTATSTNAYAASRWVGAAKRKLASSSCIEIILESRLWAKIDRGFSLNALFRLRQKCAVAHRGTVPSLQTDLWHAVRDTPGHAGNYNILISDDSERTA